MKLLIIGLMTTFCFTAYANNQDLGSQKPNCFSGGKDASTLYDALANILSDSRCKSVVSIKVATQMLTRGISFGNKCAISINDLSDIGIGTLSVKLEGGNTVTLPYDAKHLKIMSVQDWESQLRSRAELNQICEFEKSEATQPEKEELKKDTASEQRDQIKPRSATVNPIGSPTEKATPPNGEATTSNAVHSANAVEKTSEPKTPNTDNAIGEGIELSPPQMPVSEEGYAKWTPLQNEGKVEISPAPSRTIDELAKEKIGYTPGVGQNTETPNKPLPEGGFGATRTPTETPWSEMANSKPKSELGSGLYDLENSAQSSNIDDLMKHKGDQPFQINGISTAPRDLGPNQKLPAKIEGPTQDPTENGSLTALNQSESAAVNPIQELGIKFTKCMHENGLDAEKCQEEKAAYENAAGNESTSNSESIIELKNNPIVTVTAGDEKEKNKFDNYREIRDSRCKGVADEEEISLGGPHQNITCGELRSELAEYENGEYKGFNENRAIASTPGNAVVPDDNTTPKECLELPMMLALKAKGAALDKTGSNQGYGRCVKFSGTSISDLAKGDANGGTQTASWNGLWGAEEFVKAVDSIQTSCENIKKDTLPAQNGKSQTIGELQSSIKQQTKIITKYIKMFEDCAITTAVVSFKVEDYISDPDLKDMENKVSFDSAIKCRKGTAIETQDFPTCVSMVNAYDTFFVGQTAMEQLQPIMLEKKRSDAQADVMKDSKNGGGVAFDATLRMQKKDLNAQGDVAGERAGFQAIKAATLGGFMSSMPERSDVIAHCKNIAPKLSPAQAEFGDLYKLRGPEACESVVQDSAYGFILNTKARDAVKAAMIKAGIEAAAYAFKKNLLDDQGNKIDDAINQVNAFQPVDFKGAQQDLVAEKCVANPMDPECMNQPTEYHDLGGQSFSFGGSGGNTTVGGAMRSTELGDGLNAQKPLSNNSTDAASLASIGGVDGGADRGPSGILGAPGAAGVTNEQRGGGGGGGGLSLGGGGGGGGGGGSGSDGAGGASSSNAITASNASYSDSKGILGYGGGSGLLGGSKKSKDGTNPFADLIGNKGARKGGTLNFRDPAQEKTELGDDNKSIFNRLTERYGTVKNSKRLLEYESK